MDRLVFIFAERDRKQNVLPTRKLDWMAEASERMP
jgi:hypothetical protein